MLSGFDERGQAIQIGAVLLFGILIVGLSSYQAFVVPDQNRQIEFNHNQDVQGELQDLRNGIVSIPGGSDGRSVSVPLGVQYPSRVIAVNPGPATGSLRTTGTTNGDVNATVLNATAEGETGDFWDGQDHVYASGGIVYRPNYKEYRQAPQTLYDNTVLFNQYGGRNLSITGQRLVEDDRINLVTLNGSLSVARSGTASIDLQPTSSSTRTITVENAAAGENVTVSVATRLNESTWRTLLEPELIENDGHVYNITTEPISGSPFQELSVRLETDVEYTLQVTRVGIGTGVREPDGAYLTTVSGNGSAVPEGSTKELVVEVRDSLNNPVSGVEVNASTNRSSATPSADTTDGDGQIAFTYEAPSNIDGGPQSVAVNLSTVVDPANRGSFDPETVDNASFSLTVRNTDGSGTDGSGISGDVVYNGDAVNADGPEQDNTIPAGINFSVTNEFDQSITISGIDIVPADDTINSLNDQADPNGEIARSEVYVDGDKSDAFVDVDRGFSLPAAVDLDSDGFLNNGNAEITAGGTATVYLYEFEDGGGEVNMTGEDVEVSVTYQLDNGLFGVKTFTVTPTFSGQGGGGSGLPSGDVAYDDTNDNGQYDTGEATYTTSDVRNGNFNGNENLVIARTVDTTKADINVGDLTVQANVLTDSGNTAALLSSGQTVVESGVTIEGGKVEINGETTTADGATIRSFSDNVILKSSNGAGGPLSAVGASIDSASGITLESSGDMNLDSASLTAGGTSMTATLNQGRNSLFVDGASFTDADDDTLVYSPNGITVSGSPSSGSVSKN